MGTVRNILFIMCDQLRADYVSCNGHPTLHTPHIDALAARGSMKPDPGSAMTLDIQGGRIICETPGLTL